MADIKNTGNVTPIWPNQMIRPVGGSKNSPQKRQKSEQKKKQDRHQEESPKKTNDDNQGIDEYA